MRIQQQLYTHNYEQHVGQKPLNIKRTHWNKLRKINTVFLIQKKKPMRRLCFCLSDQTVLMWRSSALWCSCLCSHLYRISNISLSNVYPSRMSLALPSKIKLFFKIFISCNLIFLLAIMRVLRIWFSADVIFFNIDKYSICNLKRNYSFLEIE